MNKYQKALDWLSISIDCDDDKKAVEILQELVDKVTPKQPTINKDLLDDEAIKKYDEYGCVAESQCVCPTCMRKSIYDSEHNIRFNHCANCGQAIDWSDEYE